VCLIAADSDVMAGSSSSVEPAGDRTSQALRQTIPIISTANALSDASNAGARPEASSNAPSTTEPHKPEPPKDRADAM
jgi:hypothetical protein